VASLRSNAVHNPSVRRISTGCVEVCTFVAVIYFAFRLAMSRYSRRLEAQGTPKA